jgi:hypothetical protein
MRRLAARCLADSRSARAVVVALALRGLARREQGAEWCSCRLAMAVEMTPLAEWGD